MTQNEKYRGVKGWLLFFCIVLVFGNPAIIVSSLSIFFLALDNPVIKQLPDLVSLLTVLNIIHVLTRIFGIYAGVALWKAQPKAVTFTRIYLYSLIVYAILLILLPYMVTMPLDVQQTLAKGTLNDALTVIVFSTIWLSYLKKSKRVKATYNFQ